MTDRTAVLAERARDRDLNNYLDSLFDYYDVCIVCRDEPQKDEVAFDVDGWHGIPADISSPVICKCCAQVEEVIEKWELDQI